MRLIVGLICLELLGCNPSERHTLRPALAPRPVAVYEAAWRQAPADPQRLWELGWAYLLNGRPREAVELLQRLVEQTPADPDAHYYLGVALARQQRKEEAIQGFKRAVELAPGLAEAHWGLALLYNERGDGY
ncbi:MAG: tetratricopeptide repeat protein, partial [Candidatus Latescibacteria bacterium]|nr:tetratricopeptide repeat protein [Candidatus Latescibacterota bacterium]